MRQSTGQFGEGEGQDEKREGGSGEGGSEQRDVPAIDGGNGDPFLRGEDLLAKQGAAHRGEQG